MIELKQVPPNKGTENEYARKLKKLAVAMVASVMYWTLADYGKRTAYEMATALRKRVRKWDKLFGKDAERIAEWFVKSVRKQTEVGMAKSFKAVGRKMRPAPEFVMDAIRLENVDLIRSIPRKFFEGILEVAVMSIIYSWTKEKLKEELQKRADIMNRRIINIVSDQNHKTTALIKKEICKRNGVKYAKWKYTWRSETPREHHIEANGAIFEIEKGCLIEGEYILPTEKINCKCDFTPVLPEYDDDMREEIEKNVYYRRMARFG